MSGSVQVTETFLDRDNLIGSFYTGGVSAKKSVCLNCKEVLIPGSKYCGECGSVAGNSVIQPTSISSNENLSSEYLNAQRRQVIGMPAFAQVSSRLRRPVSTELKQEYCKVTCLLARERVFLVLHHILFLVGNFFGLWCAFKAYNDLIADEVTKLIVALVPMFFINTVSFAAVVPIGGTKKQIARLKERIIHIHYQIEYSNLA